MGSRQALALAEWDRSGRPARLADPLGRRLVGRSRAASPGRTPPAASHPPAELRGALEGLYAAGSKPGPTNHFLVAADPTVELSDDVVTLAPDVAQCLAPHAVMLPREGWEGQRHDQTPAPLLIARYAELGGNEAVYRPVGNAEHAALDGPPPPGP